MAKKRRCEVIDLGDCVLPLSMASETTAIIGLRGAGKTNTCGVIVEELLDAEQPVVVIDPTDVWWGLKSSADGKSPGYPVIVFGGSHGDLSLDEHSGKTIAEFVAHDRPAACILSLRHLRKGEQRRFVREFCGELYHLKGKPTHRSPLTVVIDEAPLFIPQKVIGDMSFVVSAVEDLIARGRASGFGVVLISQRAATINKDVLTQADTIIAHRLTSPQDRKALREWFEENAEAPQMKEILASLAGLRKGEGWVWSPQHELLIRAQIRLRHTFDSSASPKLGQKITAPKKIAEIDLDKLRGRLADAIEKAKGDDPRELHKRIAELQRQVNAKQQTPVAEVKVEPVEVPAVSEADLARVEKAAANLQHALDRALVAFENGVNAARAAVESVHVIDAVQGINAVHESLHAIKGAKPEPVQRSDRPLKNSQHAARGEGPQRTGRTARDDARRQHADGVRGEHSSARVPTSDLKLTSAQQRILDALAFWESMGVPEVDNVRLGAVAHMDTSGGYFSNVVGPLSTFGLVDRGRGATSLTAAGRAMARVPEQAASLADYHSQLRQRIRKIKSAGGRTVEIFDLLIESDSGEMTCAEIGERLGMDHTGGYFSNVVGPLSTLGLIKRHRGVVALNADLVFPEGLR